MDPDQHNAFIDTDGNPVKFIAIRKDITDRVKAQEKLEHTLSENIEQKKTDRRTIQTTRTIRHNERRVCVNDYS